jgi:hypothetical protein
MKRLQAETTAEPDALLIAIILGAATYRWFFISILFLFPRSCQSWSENQSRFRPSDAVATLLLCFT